MRSHYYIFLLVLISFFSCKDNSKSKIAQSETLQFQTGEELAQIHCQRCHQMPIPQQLDKKSWREFMLPRMGYMLGIYPNPSTRDSLIEIGKGGELVEKSQIFPKQSLISMKEWDLIQDYFLLNAPEKLDSVAKKEISIGLENFKVKIPQFTISPPSTTLIQFSPNGHIYLGDAYSQTLIEFDKKLNFVKKGNVRQGAVNLKETSSEILLTVMDSFSPTDNPSGFLLGIPKNDPSKSQILIDSLQRPVHASYADLNEDGRMDVVISEYGKWTGKLSLYLNEKEGFKQKILINQAGATRTYLKDFNQDGLLDIAALFGQGNEGIYILYNQGNGNFKSEQVLQFSASNGSSYFDVVDFNKDGYFDFVYTAGDNADFSPIMKPYHGVYVYLNDGKNHFKQEIFYQLNGAYSAIARDFDQDGDMDIATISFFPDYQNTPEESFVYLENDGKNNFKATTFKNSSMGRWIVMDCADYDSDGDEDLILGSMAFEIIPKNDDLLNNWVEKGIPFVLLENTLK